MAFSICIKIGNIKGESNIAGHTGEIDVVSWNWGVTQSASAQRSGAIAGAADVKDLTFTKYVDNASPTLFQECFRGNNQNQAVLYVFKSSGDTPLEFIKITMDDTVIISSVKAGDPLPEDRYSETVTLSFAHAKFEYTQLTSKGKGATTTADITISKRH
jgi:type VI secretion system secreted protein Hcp